MESEKVIKAIDVISEEQIKFILERSRISSSSPKEVDWLYHWWMEEFKSRPPIARQIVIVGNEGYAPALCFAVEHAKFVIYRLDEINWWFNKLGEIEEFSSYEQICEYLKDLVNQDLACWKEYMKWHRGQI
jgi:hypothetical protein